MIAQLLVDFITLVLSMAEYIKPSILIFFNTSNFKIKLYSKRFFFRLHGPSMLPDKAKFVVCSIISLALSFWMKHQFIRQLQKPAKFLAFYWSTSRSQAFIGQLLGTSRVVHLPQRTIMVLFTISGALLPYQTATDLF